MQNDFINRFCQINSWPESRDLRDIQDISLGTHGAASTSDIPLVGGYWRGHPYALTPNIVELIPTLGALSPLGGPVQDPVLTDPDPRNFRLWKVRPTKPASSPQTRNPHTQNLVARLSGEWNSNSHGARPIHLIITMIRWIRTSSSSVKLSLSLSLSVCGVVKPEGRSRCLLLLHYYAQA